MATHRNYKVKLLSYTAYSVQGEPRYKYYIINSIFVVECRRNYQFRRIRQYARLYRKIQYTCVARDHVLQIKFREQIHINLFFQYGQIYKSSTPVNGIPIKMRMLLV